MHYLNVCIMLLLSLFAQPVSADGFWVSTEGIIVIVIIVLVCLMCCGGGGFGYHRYRRGRPAVVI
jgi:hypothetical protein